MYFLEVGKDPSFTISQFPNVFPLEENEESHSIKKKKQALVNPPN